MSKKMRYLLLFILVISILYFIERKIDRISEGIPERTTTERELSVEFGEAVFPNSTTGVVVHHAYYSLSYHEKFEQSEWIAYELKRSHLSNNEFERPYFTQDRSIKSESAHWRNYKNSGYDRGHLCPAGDRRFSYDAYLETFLTSNISPMDHDFNAGVWNDLEKQVRRWAKKMDGVFVITGGVLKEGMETIGEEHVAVPRAFYKIIVDRTQGKWQAIAFLIPNEERTDSYRRYITTIDAIEDETGIDFFPGLEDGLEANLESENTVLPWF